MINAVRPDQTHTKTCCRCGTVFDALGNKRLCSTCAASTLARSKRSTATPRESQIISCICTGLSNKEIAGDLILTEGTVKIYLSRIFRKFHLRNRTELAIFAHRDRTGNNGETTQTAVKEGSD